MIFRKLIGKVLETKLATLVTVVVVAFFSGALVITLAEPGFNTYGEGLWYAFTAMTTIGFGDLVVTTFIGKLITGFLAILAIFVFSFITGVIASYYSEMRKARISNELYEFRDKLENLTNLSKEELEEISAKIKKVNSINSNGRNERQKTLDKDKRGNK